MASEPPRKKMARGKTEAPETMVVRLVRASGPDDDGAADKKDAGAALPQIDLPLKVTPAELERLVNELLGNDEKVPFAFYVTEDKKEVVGSLKETIEEQKISTESVLEIKYEALSLFRVHPVTRCTDSLPGHTEALLHVSFSPDGTQLASGGGDTTVRFWDTNTRMPRHVCKGHRNHVLCTAWSPDGLRFASGDKNGELRLWDPISGAAVGRPFSGHRQWITSMSWEPQHVNAACERLVTGSKDRTARVWNVRTGRCEMTLTGHDDSVECVKWGGEGLLYTASRDKTINVWAQRSADDEKAGNGSLFKLVRTLKGHAHRINAMALSTDFLNRTGAYDHTGGFFDEEAHKSSAAAAAAAAAAAIAAGKPYDRAAAHLAATNRYNNAKRQHEASAPAGVPFERLVSCSDDLTLYLWHPTLDKKPVERMFGHQQVVTHLSFSPDGRYLASASFDRKVKLWCGRTARFMATLTGHVAHVYQVCWAPDSRLLCSASKDSTLKVWEVRNPRKPKETLGGHFDEVYALDWSPNGEILASGGKDRVLKIWAN